MVGHLKKFAVVVLGLLGLTALLNPTPGMAAGSPLPRYGEVTEGYKAKGYQETKGIKITIEGEDFASQGGGRAAINRGVGGNTGKSVNWGRGEGSWLEWRVSVPETGLYNIALKYYPTHMEEKDKAFIIRELMIDGRYPFYEMTDIMLSYLWKPSSKEEEKIKRDMEYGEAPPKARRDLEPNAEYWRMEVLKDWSDAFLEPYLFYLEAGSHTLRLISKTKSLGLLVSPPQAMELDRIEIFSPEIESYKELERRYKAMGAKETRDILVKVQGEDYYSLGGPGQMTYGTAGAPIRSGVVYINAPALFIREAGEPEGYYNALGWWHIPGSWVRWKFSVPEDGLYKIAVKYSQGTAQPIPLSARNLKIDDRIPFKEMGHIKFSTTGAENESVYGIWNMSSASGYIVYRITLSDGSYVAGAMDTAKWALKTLSDEAGHPYLFYLTAGEHSLEMSSVLGPELHRVRTMLTGVEDELIKLISSVDSLVTDRKGSDMSKINVAAELPGVLEMLKRHKAELDEVSSILTKFAGGTAPPVVAWIDIVKEQIDNVVKDPNVLLTKEKLDPNSLYSFRSMTVNTIENLVGQIGNLQALDVDFIAAASPNVKIKMQRGSFFKTVKKMWVEFIDSFKEEDSFR
jgi:hypothetical protein